MPKLRIAIVAATAAMTAAACPGGFDASDQPLQLTLAGHTVGSNDSALPGTLVTLEVKAQAGSAEIAGLQLMFSSTAMGLAFVPAQAVTNSEGIATSTALVSYSATPTVALVNGGGSSLAVSLTDIVPRLQIKARSTSTSFQAAGALVDVTVSITSEGDAPHPVAGLNVAFASNTQAVTFTPPMIVTDASGSATSTAFVPYGSNNIVATTIAAGFAATASLVNLPATVTAKPVSYVDATVAAASGRVYAVTASVLDGSGSAVQGVPVMFTQIGGGNNVFTPNPSVTGAAGSATSYVFVANVGSATPGRLVGLAWIGNAIAAGSGSGSGLACMFTSDDL
jgi:hypothetical protein